MYPEGFEQPELIEKIATFRQRFKASNQTMATSDAFPMMPERILADTRKALPDDAIITTDVGWNNSHQRCGPLALHSNERIYFSIFKQKFSRNSSRI